MTGARHTRTVAAIIVAVSMHLVVGAGVAFKSPRSEPSADPGKAGVMFLVAATAAGASAGQVRLRKMQSVPPAPEREQLQRDDVPEMASPDNTEPRIDADENTYLKPVVRAKPVETAALPISKPVPVPRRKPEYVQTARPSPVPVTAPSPAAPRSPTEKTGPLPQAATASAATSGEQGDSSQTQIARDGGGEISAHGDYLAAIRTWLQEHKRYPRRARLRMMRGEAVIGFVLDRSGRVVSFELRRSSGHDILDREVLAMVRRASPMPSFPPDVTRERMDFSLPVMFNIQ